MNSTMDTFLNLAGTTCAGWGQVEGYVWIELKIISVGTQCRHCQSYTKELHQTTFMLVRDLPAFGQPVYLRVPRRRFYCRRCQRYVTEKLEFMDWRRTHTRRYEQNIYGRVLKSNIEQISREENLSSEEIQGVFNWVSKQQKKTGNQ